MLLHVRRQLWRGYNQSDIIARGIASALGCCASDDAVTRIVNNSSQTKQRSRKARMQNSENIFRVTNGDILDKKNTYFCRRRINNRSTLFSLIDCITDSCENTKISIATLPAQLGVQAAAFKTQITTIQLKKCYICGVK